MNTSRVLVAALTVTFVLAWASSASAQKIRNYGGQAETEYGGGESGGTNAQTSGGAAYYPGQPRPQSSGQQQQGQQQQQGTTGEEDARPDGSFVTVFAPGGSQKPVEELNLPPGEMYRGVIPGERDTLPMLERAKRKSADYDEPNRITWIGFQPKKNVTRVFFQTAREANYSDSSGSGTLTLTFRDTKIPMRNFSRFIDTTFFDRVVTRIEANQPDRTTTVVTIFLRESASPEFTQTDSYLYLDFPHTPPASEEE